MKKKYFIHFVFLLISSFCFAQTYNMPAAGSASYSTCTGNFYDTGGVGGNYNNNQSSVITFCPSTPGDIITINFSSFDTEPNGASSCYDYLEVWNENGIIGAPTSVYCNVLAPFTITSTNMANGCLTFRFTSDGVVTRAGWAASISCVTPCIAPTAALVDNSTVNICPPTSSTPGSLTVAFDASASTSSQGPVSRYDWDWGDGTTSNTVTPTTTHTYPGTGRIYTMRLAVRNSNFDVDALGCKSMNECKRIIKVLPPPNFTGTTTGPLAGSCGSNVSLTGIAATQNYTSPLPPAFSTITYLPQGAGGTFTSGINYSDYFPINATLTPGCYPTVNFSIEHSYAGDLEIYLVAPTGQQVLMYGVVGGVLNSTKFGTCSNNNDGDGVPGCPANYIVKDSGGVAWGAAGNTTSSTTTCAGYPGPCDPGNYYISKTYNSINSFSALNGADLNGTWTIKIKDNLAQDDGYLFSWSLTFPPACYDLRETVNPDMVSGVWSTAGSGPAVPANSSTSTAVVDPGPDACPSAGTCLGNKLTNTISVGPFTAPGSFVYDFIAADEFGCQYIRSVTVNVPNGPTFTVPADITQCAGTTIPVANFTSSPAGATFTWTNSDTGIGLAASGSGSVPAFTATNATGSPIIATITVTATPATGCATIHTYTITINPNVTPTFNPVGPFCKGDAVPPGSLPGTSLNGYAGTWSPAAISTATVGSTIYTFTPNPGPCATTATLTVVVNAPATPTTASVTQPTCGTPSGTIVINTQAGVEYSVNGGATYQASATFSGLAPGTYTIGVRNTVGNTCATIAAGTITINAVPTAPAVPTTASVTQPTCATPSGTIVINTQAGTEYSINGGASYQASATFSGLAPGTYTIVVRTLADTTCSATGATITINAVPTTPAVPTTASVTHPTCSIPTGTIVINTQAGTEYSINGGASYQASATFSGLAPGSYTLAVRNLTDTTCSTVGAGTVTINAVPTVPAAPTTASVTQPTCGIPSGTIVINAQAGVEYSINGGASYQGSATFSGLAPGSYTLSVRKLADTTCSATGAGTVTINAVPTAPAAPTTASITQPTCATPSGAIVINPQAGVEYSINGGASYQASATFSGLAPGTYTLSVRNLSDTTCSATGAGTVTINAVPTAPAIPTTASITQPTCGVPSGTIVINTQAGVEYSINGGASYQASATFSGLAPGTYTLAVRNLADTTCSATGAGTVTINAVPTAPSVPTTASVTQPTCAVPSGTIVINTQAGVEYSINGGSSYQASATFSGLAPGTYTLAVRKLADTTCFTTGVGTVTINAVPTAPAIPTTASVTQPTCATPSGTIVINSQVGVEYSINGGASYQAGTTFSGLAPGTYTLAVRNLADTTCSATGAGTVTINAVPTAPSIPTTASVTQPTCAIPSGTIVINSQAGVEYSINGGASYQASATFSGLAPGSYTIAVRNLADTSCSATGGTIVITVSPGAPAVPTVIVTQPTCAIPTGTIEFNSQAGAEYSINAGASYQASTTFSGLSPGTYTLRVRSISDNSCYTAGAATITINAAPTAPAVPTTASVTQPTCATPSGTIVINTQAGVEYSINGGASYQASATFSGLAPGTYTLAVRKLADTTCFTTGVGTVTINAVPTAPTSPTTASVTQPTCAVPSGTIVINTQAGVEYSINGGASYQASATFSGLAPGTYTLAVRKLADTTCFTAGAGTVTINAIPTPPAAPTTASVTQPTCALPSGSIVINPQAGVEYSINGGASYQASATFSGLAPGTYTLSVRSLTDTSCFGTGAGTVTINAVPTAPTSPTTASVTQPTCAVPSGTIVINTQAGVEYSINGGASYQASTTFTGLAPGTYTLAVRNLADTTCSATGAGTVTINTVPTAPTAPTTATVTQPTCAVPSGTIVINTQAGIEYSINGGASFQASATFSGLTPGTYTLAVRNLSDTTCLTTGGTVTINAIPTPPAAPTTASVTQPTCAVPTGAIVINPQAGVEYSINGGVSYQASATFSGLAPGTYTLAVRSLADATCLGTGAGTVTINAVPTAPTIPTTASITQPTCATPSGTIVINSQVGVEYSINGGASYQASATFAGLAPGNYTLSVRNLADTTCSATGAGTVTINAVPMAPAAPTTTSVTQPTCATPSGTIVINTQAGIEYSIDGGASYQASATFAGLAPGTYTLSVRNLSDTTCSSTGTTVTINAVPIAPAAPTTASVTQPTCATPSGTIVINTQAGVEYSINGGASYQASATFAGLAPGTYTLGVRNLADTTCSAIGSTVTINAVPTAPAVPTAASVTQPTCATPSGTIVINTQVGVEYSINGGASYQVSEIFAGLAPGTYTLGVRNLSDTTCSATGSTVIINAIPTAPASPTTASVTQPTCATPSGAIVINPQAGVEYSINGGASYQASTTFSGLAPGTYIISVRSLTDNTCSATGAGTVTINAVPTAPAAPTASSVTQPTCAMPSGTIVINSQTGVEYSINGGASYQASTTFSGLAPGTYPLAVRNLSDTTCFTTGSTVTINAVPTAPAVPTTVSVTQPTCATPSGTIVITTQAGVEYSINGGASYQASATFAGLAPGTYTLAVRNLADTTCSAIGSTVTINAVPTAPAVPTAASVTQPTCATPSGTIVINTQAGVEYSINGGASYQASATFAGLAPGTYTLAVRNLSDTTCSTIGSTVTINAVPTAPAVPTTVSVTQPTCATPSGTIVINTQAGVEYSINGGASYQASATFAGLTPGNYTLVVRNLGDTTCFTTGSTVTINAVPTTPTVPATASVTQPTCGTPSGTIVINSQAGVEYSINGGASYQASATFAGLVPGNYTLAVRNLGDITCFTTGSTVTINAVPMAPTTPTTASVTQPTCATPSGTIVMNTQTGVEFSINGGASYQASVTFTGLAPGTYTLAVRNLSDTTCSATGGTITINAVPTAPVAPTATVIQPSCATPSGTIIINPQGGVQYSINGGVTYQSSPTFAGLAPGTYTLAVRNLADMTCSAIGSTITIIPESGCDSDGDGVLDVTEISDGTNPLDQCSLNLASQTIPPSSTWFNADCDDDGVNNSTEITDNTNLFEPCSLIIASQTIPAGISNWNNLDCDNDSVFNGYEIGNGPGNPQDTDSDGIPDYLDIDDDNDNIITVNENPDSNNDGNPSDAFDSDDDGIPDYLEPNNDIDSEDNLDIFSLVTPNGDGDNDVFVINNVEQYPDNTLEIYNRWGVLVYEVQGYGQAGKYFKGVSEGRVTISQASQLPVGTYFYAFKYRNASGDIKKRSGYLYINR